MKAKITPRKEMVLLYRPEQADAQEKLPQLLEKWELNIVWWHRRSCRCGPESWQAICTAHLSRQKREDYPQLTAAMAMGGFNSRRLDQLLKRVWQRRVSLPIKNGHHPQ